MAGMEKQNARMECLAMVSGGGRKSGSGGKAAQQKRSVLPLLLPLLVSYFYLGGVKLTAFFIVCF